MLGIKISGRIVSFLSTFWFFTQARFREWISYKTSALLWLLGWVFHLLTFYFMAVALSTFSSDYLVNYGGDYFLFLLTGMTLWYGVVYPSMAAFSEAVQTDIFAGVIGTLLATPTHIITYILATSGWEYTRRFLHGVIILAFGLLLAGGFGVNLSFSSIGFAVLLVLLVTAANLGFGLLAVALTLVYKYSGRVVILSIVYIYWYLCGAYFPIEILPGWLQLLSRTLPVTYALEGLREVLLNGSFNVYLIYYDIGMLALFCPILLPIGLYSIKRALKKVKKEGTLEVY